MSPGGVTDFVIDSCELVLDFVEIARKLLFLGSGSIVFFLIIKYREIFLLRKKVCGPVSFSGLQSE